MAREHGWTLVPPRGLRSADAPLARSAVGIALQLARSAVGIARPPAGTRAGRAASRSGRAADPQPRHDVRADLDRDPRQQPVPTSDAAGSPTPSTRHAGQLPGLEPLRAAVRGDVRSHDLLPPGQQARSDQRAGPVAVPDQLLDRVAQPRRIPGVRSRTAPGLVHRRRAPQPPDRRRLRAASPGQQPPRRIARPRHRVRHWIRPVPAVDAATLSGHDAPRPQRCPSARR